MRQSGLVWLWISLLVVVLDQGTKIAATELLTLHQPHPITSFFNLTLAHNEGAAFNFLSDAGGWQRWFFVILATAVSLALLIWLSRMAATARWSSISLTLILGGAVGNLWDRIQHGYVVDFIQLYYDQWYYPTFNIADSAIFVGAVMLLLESLRGEKSLTP
ncbi:MAG: signal peptidase II [Halothiobacillaceae bacterium]|nr:MAG: signal peptidase II [Halothiobacillaceae bacterium]